MINGNNLTQGIIDSTANQSNSNPEIIDSARFASSDFFIYFIVILLTIVILVFIINWFKLKKYRIKKLTEYAMNICDDKKAIDNFGKIIGLKKEFWIFNLLKKTKIKTAPNGG